jgi:hypothetical protein
MPRTKKDIEPEDQEPNAVPGESLPAMEDTVRKLSSIFSENMRIPEGPAVIEIEEGEVMKSVTFPEGPDDEDEDDE